MVDSVKVGQVVSNRLHSGNRCCKLEMARTLAVSLVHNEFECEKP